MPRSSERNKIQEKENNEDVEENGRQGAPLDQHQETNQQQKKQKEKQQKDDSNINHNNNGNTTDNDNNSDEPKEEKSQKQSQSQLRGKDTNSKKKQPGTGTGTGTGTPSPVPLAPISSNKDQAESIALSSNGNGNLSWSCLEATNSFQKVQCYSIQHPGFVLSATLTCLFCFYCACFSKRRRTRRWRPGFSSAFRRARRARGGGNGNGGGHAALMGDDDDAGEYAALTVYDELLDDFDKDDLSYSVASAFDSVDSDDESVGTIISQWSDVNNGNGTGTVTGTGRRKQRIEMIPFDDGRLTLNEING